MNDGGMNFRTGRVGNPGRATSLYVPGEDGRIAAGLVRVLEEAGQVRLIDFDCSSLTSILNDY